MDEAAWIQVSEACERNKAPILEILRSVLADARTVLEIGSGTGQHAEHFARELPHLTWQTGDVPAHHRAIRARLEQAGLDNARPPLDLDLDDAPWKLGPYDAVYSANVLHIVSPARGQRLVEAAGAATGPGGRLCLYGPFKYADAFTSESNARFDAALRQRDPESGIRDFETIDALAKAQGFALIHDHAMPANNQLLVWRRT